MNQLLKLELEPIVMHYRGGRLDIEGEESYRNWIASKCDHIPRDDFKAVVAMVLQSPPRVRPSYKVFFAVWSKIQGERAQAYREKVRAEKVVEPPRFQFSDTAWKMLQSEIEYLADRKKKESGQDSIDVPFV